MGLKSRTKGAAAERELVRLLDGYLGDLFPVSRNYDQASIGGADIVTIPGWSVEIRNRAEGYLPGWMRDAIARAPLCDVPVLVYRLPRRPQNRRWWVEILATDLLPEYEEPLSSPPLMTVHMPLRLWAEIVRLRAKKSPTG